MIYFVVVSLFQEAWDYRIASISFIVPFAFLLIVQFRRLISHKIEYGFLIIALSFGTLACICMPTLAEVSYDGQIHFRNAVAVSFIEEAEYTGADKIMLDAFAVEKLDMIEAGNLSGIWNPKMDLNSIQRVNAALLSADSDSSSITRMEATQTYETSTWVSIRAFGYIPNATGLWLGRLLGLNCLDRYFLAREVSLIFYSIIFFFSIRQLKTGKAIVAALGLLPSAVLMAANFSYDPWCYALITFSISKYVGCLQKGQSHLTMRNSLIIFITFILGVLVKAVLFPIALVFFLCPKEMFKSKRNCYLFRLGAVATVLIIAASFILPYFVSFSDVALSSVSSDSRGGENVNSARQLLYILNHPFAFLETLISFLGNYFSPSSFFDATGIFAYMPYLVLQKARYLPASILQFLLLAVIVLLDRNNNRGCIVSKHQLCIASVIGSLSALFLVILSLYLSFTPVGSNYIGGVQNRYVLPLLAPILLLSLNNFPTIAIGKKELNEIVILSELIIWILAIALIFLFAF